MAVNSEFPQALPLTGADPVSGPDAGRSRATTLGPVDLAFLPDFDLVKLVAMFWRRAALSAAAALLVFVSVVIITVTATPLYTASADVMLDSRKEEVSSVTSVLSGLPADSTAVDTEAEILKSRQLAERVAAVLKLIDDPEFNPDIVDSKGKVKATTQIGQAVSGVVGVSNAGGSTAATLDQQIAHERIIDRILNRLSVKRNGLTRMITVSFTSNDRAKAARIANTFADRYLLEQLETKFEATQQANNWLSQRLSDLKVQVQAAEEAVSQYKIANNLLSASGATLTEQEISTYNQRLAQAQTEQAEQEAALSTARAQLAAGSSGDDVGVALGSQVIQQLRTQRAAVSGKVANLAGRYGIRHPEMLKAQRELTDIDLQITDEIGRVISNLEARSAVARQRTASVRGSLSGAQGALAVNNRAEVKLRELERNADSVRTLYESFLGRYKETSSSVGVERSDARVVSRAKIPTQQSSPKIFINLALGLALALSAWLAVTLIAELADTGLYTSEEAERRLNLPYLGSIPLLKSVDDTADSPADHLIKRPLSAFAEAFRGLRTSVSYSRLGDPATVIGVTSSLPGEGKTVTAICMARSYAIQGLSTVLIDSDVRRRSVGRLLGVEPEAGLVEVLSGTVSLDQALMTDPGSDLRLLLLSKGSFTPKDLFGSRQMDVLIADLRSRFDIVIFDTAPILPVADTRLLAPKLDTTVFLTRWRKTPGKAAEAALRFLRAADAHVAGVALSQVDMKQQARYGYGDAAYYYNDYKKYYAA